MAPESAPEAEATGVALLRRTGRALLRLPFPLSALPLLAWAALIWHLSSYREIDTPPLVPRLPLIGNLAHAFEFGMLALWSVLLLPRRAGWPSFSTRTTLGTFTLLLGYALVDEWHQSHIPERNASLLDVLTDAAGIASVLAVIAFLGRPAAGTPGLRRHLLTGLLACLATAALATTYQRLHGPGPWPF